MFIYFIEWHISNFLRIGMPRESLKAAFFWADTRVCPSLQELAGPCWVWPQARKLKTGGTLKPGRSQHLEYSTVSLLPMFALGCGWALGGGGGAESAAGLSPPVPLCLLPGCPAWWEGRDPPSSSRTAVTILHKPGAAGLAQPKVETRSPSDGVQLPLPHTSSHEMFSHFFVWNVT